VAGAGMLLKQRNLRGDPWIARESTSSRVWGSPFRRWEGRGVGRAHWDPPMAGAPCWLEDLKAILERVCCKLSFAAPHYQIGRLAACASLDLNPCFDSEAATGEKATPLQNPLPIPVFERGTVSADDADASPEEGAWGTCLSGGHGSRMGPLGRGRKSPRQGVP